MGMINRYRHRYRPIRKLQLSVIIGIGRYEKKVIGRPLGYVIIKVAIQALNLVG